MNTGGALPHCGAAAHRASCRSLCRPWVAMQPAMGSGDLEAGVSVTPRQRVPAARWRGQVGTVCFDGLHVVGVVAAAATAAAMAASPTRGHPRSNAPSSSVSYCVGAGAGVCVSLQLSLMPGHPRRATDCQRRPDETHTHTHMLGADAQRSRLRYERRQLELRCAGRVISSVDFAWPCRILRCQNTSVAATSGPEHGRSSRSEPRAPGRSVDRFRSGLPPVGRPQERTPPGIPKGRGTLGACGASMYESECGTLVWGGSAPRGSASRIRDLCCDAPAGSAAEDAPGSASFAEISGPLQARDSFLPSVPK